MYVLSHVQVVVPVPKPESDTTTSSLSERDGQLQSAVEDPSSSPPLSGFTTSAAPAISK